MPFFEKQSKEASRNHYQLSNELIQIPEKTQQIQLQF